MILYFALYKATFWVFEPLTKINLDFNTDQNFNSITQQALKMTQFGITIELQGLYVRKM